MKRLRFALMAALSAISLESNALPIFLYVAWVASWSSEFRQVLSIFLFGGGEMSVMAVWVTLAAAFFFPPVWIFITALCGRADHEAVRVGLRNHFIRVYFFYPWRFVRRIIA